MTPLIEAILAGLSTISFPTRSKAEGTYLDLTGTMKIDINGDQVLVTLPKAMAPSRCIVERGKIRVTVRGGEVVFAYDGHGDAFVGPNKVRLSKKA
jgi:hypothetical protein